LLSLLSLARRRRAREKVERALETRERERQRALLDKSVLYRERREREMRHTSGNKFIYPFARAGGPRPARCVSIDHHLFTVSAWRRDNCLQSLYEQMDFSHHSLRWRATKIAWPAVTSVHSGSTLDLALATGACQLPFGRNSGDEIGRRANPRIR